jgi:hypothetical protein
MTRRTGRRSACWRAAERPWRRLPAWWAPAGRLRRVFKRPQQRSAWITMTCGVGPDGSATSRWRCGPTPIWQGCGPRVPRPWGGPRPHKKSRRRAVWRGAPRNGGGGHAAQPGHSPHAPGRGAGRGTHRESHRPVGDVAARPSHPRQRVARPTAGSGPDGADGRSAHANRGRRGRRRSHHPDGRRATPRDAGIPAPWSSQRGRNGGHPNHGLGAPRGPPPRATTRGRTTHRV